MVGSFLRKAASAAIILGQRAKACVLTISMIRNFVFDSMAPNIRKNVTDMSQFIMFNVIK
jgi:hypothetical protein